MASAGIVVRNSIILVDFIEQRLREGASLDAAVVDVSPLLSATFINGTAVIVGGGVIFFDPIFAGIGDLFDGW